MNKTIYIADETLWKRAKAYGRKHGLSLSAVIVKALEQLLRPSRAGWDE